MYRPTNTTTTSDGWTTVARPSPFGRRTTAAMPSAFGGDDPRRQQLRARAEDRARDERERRAAADAEAKRKAAVYDLKNEKEYPSLGGATAATKKPTSWSSTVAAAAAARPAPVKTLTAEEKWMADYYARQEETERRLRVAAGCYDDGPEDYDGPEEDTEAWADPYADGSGGGGAGTGEYNSHLSTSGYRRGGGAW
jgi:hypothetical protein